VFEGVFVADEPSTARKREGDGDATFDSFYRREYARIVRFAFGLVGRLAVAEEVAQDALYAAYRQWAVVSTLERPELWLRRVAMNRSTSLYRRAMCESKALLRLGGQRAATALPAEDVDIWRAVRRLPARQAAAVTLQAVEQCTAAEIGEVLGCSAETARTHLRRGHDRLRVLLGEQR
jgi:RNA polymerase sigma-70 factor (ECF subfamily)